MLLVWSPKTWRGIFLATGLTSYPPQTRALARPPACFLLPASLLMNDTRCQVTIEDCTHVIDAGRVREMRYNAITRVSCLTEVWISKVREHAALRYDVN